MLTLLFIHQITLNFKAINIRTRHFISKFDYNNYYKKSLNLKLYPLKIKNIYLYSSNIKIEKK